MHTDAQRCSNFCAQQNHLARWEEGFKNVSFLESPPQRFKFSESWAGPGFCIFLTSPIGSVGCRSWGPQEGDSALSPWHPPRPPNRASLQLSQVAVNYQTLDVLGGPGSRRDP